MYFLMRLTWLQTRKEKANVYRREIEGSQKGYAETRIEANLRELTNKKIAFALNCT